MWPETHNRIELELSLLRHLLESNRALLTRLATQEPDNTEILAVAALVHSFYTGIENIFRRIALEIDKSVPDGARWHADLLMQVETTVAERPALITKELRLKLGEYMEFRHVFRHAYSFDLSWPKMRGLVLNCGDTLSELAAALDRFFETDN